MTIRFNYAINYEVVSAERLSGEFLLINFETGEYFSVTDFGADLLTLITSKVQFSSWERILSKAWNINISNDVQDEIKKFLEILLKKNIIYQIDTFDLIDFQLPMDMKREKYKFLPLNIYTDMNDLLMVDPIHDSSLEGWPNIKNEE